MPIAWYICPYKYRLRGRLNERKNHRYVAMNDFTAQIQGRGGDWQEIEIDGLGDNGIGQALVKVKAEKNVLDILDGQFYRVTGDPKLEMTIERPKPRYDKAADEIKFDVGKRTVDVKFEDVDDRVRK